MSFPLSRRMLITGALGALPMAKALAQAAPAPSAEAPGPLRLVANENPYGPSPAARQAVVEAAAQGWQYAFSEVGALAAALAAHHGVPADHVVVTAGSVEALRLAAMLWCADGGNLVAAHPTFDVLPRYAERLGCEGRRVPLDASMTHDLGAMAAAMDAETRLVYLCNPNNPTGTLLPAGAVRDFVAEISPRAPVVVDEAYLELQDDEGAHTAIERVLAGDRVVVLRTFSKLHGMAGLRVGYAIAPPDIAGRLEARRVSFMSRPGVMAALASLADTEFQAFSRARIREAMAVTTGAFDALGLAYTPSHGNFDAVDTGVPVAEFSAAMRAQGILTGRPVAGYPTWARISMGRVEDMHRLAGAMRSFLAPA